MYYSPVSSIMFRMNTVFLVELLCRREIISGCTSDLGWPEIFLRKTSMLYAWNNFVLLPIFSIYKPERSLNSRRERTRQERALCGEAVYHGPWASRMFVLGMPRMQGLHHSLPGPFLRLVFTARKHGRQSPRKVEYACLLFSTKVVIPSG